MRRFLLAAALLAAGPAAAQTISCVDKETVTRDLIRNAWIKGSVQECTHKPTGRTFFQPAGSPTPAKAPWETSAVKQAAPSPAARPTAPARAAPAASNFALLKGCELTRSALVELFRDATPLPYPRSKTLRVINKAEYRRNYYDPAGLVMFGMPVEGLSFALEEVGDEDDEYRIYRVSFGLLKTPAEVTAAVSKARGSPGIKLGDVRQFLSKSGADAITIVPDPAGTRLTCEWEY